MKNKCFRPNEILLVILLNEKGRYNIQSLDKSIGKCKKIPIISTTTIFFQKIIVKSFLDRFFTNFTPKHSELSICCLCICSLCLYEWFLFVHNLNMIVNFQDLCLVEIHVYRKIKVNFYLLCLNYVQIKITHNNIRSK